MPYRALLSTFAALAVIVGASNSTRADSGPRYIIPPAATLPVMMREAHLRADDGTRWFVGCLHTSSDQRSR